MRLFIIALCLLPNAAPAAPCIRFSGNRFCLAWVGGNKRVTLNEYVQPGETVRHWTKMITVRQYSKPLTFKEIAIPYIKARSSLFALKPQIFENSKSGHKRDVIVIMWLLAPDRSHYENIFARFVIDKNRPAKMIVFSVWVPYSARSNVSYEVQHADSWLAALGDFDPVEYPQKTTVTSSATSR